MEKNKNETQERLENQIAEVSILQKITNHKYLR